MRMIMTAALGLSLLSGTAVFAQNTSSDTTAKKKTHHKKEKKSKSTASDTATSK
jgi:hypothetical protein